jgi:CheY-like chemotaxis protein
LVVEDNSLNQLVAEGVVSKLGFEVHTVANGIEALEAMARAPYLAVLMDCHMPVMDGFTATREIRRREGSKDRTPIIAMTAGAMVEDRERCIAAGMDDYVSKPVDLAALEVVLMHWIGDAFDSEPADGSGSDDGESATDREPSIDKARLAYLRKLEAPDGSRLLTVLIDTFVSHGADRLTALRRAAETEDHDQLREVAHELKGASANIGARRLARLCGELEKVAVPASSPRWRERVDALKEEYETVKKELAYLALSML